MRIDHGWLPFAIAWALVVGVPTVAMPLVLHEVGLSPSSAHTVHDPILAWRLPAALVAAGLAVAPLALAVRQRAGRMAWVRAACVGSAWLVAALWLGLVPTSATVALTPCTTLLELGRRDDDWRTCDAWRREDLPVLVALVPTAIVTVGLAALSGRWIGPRPHGPSYRAEPRQSGLVLLSLGAGTASLFAIPVAVLAAELGPRGSRSVFPVAMPLLGGFMASLVAIGLATTLRAMHRGREPARSAAIALGWVGHLPHATIAAIILAVVVRDGLGLPYRGEEGPGTMPIALGGGWIALLAIATRWPTRSLWASIAVMGLMGLVLAVAVARS